ESSWQFRAILGYVCYNCSPRKLPGVKVEELRVPPRCEESPLGG
ncbi:unnamed protein product, partial [Ascophyllum nodosum]